MSKYYFECNDCGKQYQADEVQYICPSCKEKNTDEKPPLGVLKTKFDYDFLKKKHKENLAAHLIETDFFDLMPIENKGNLPNLRIGKTPLIKLNKLGKHELIFDLYLKDDSQNPTYSFKDRASALVSAFAKEKGIQTIVAASTGNAGSSLAGICAAQEQKAVVFVPETAPKAKLTQIIMYGAQIVPVAGNYDKAFEMSIEATEKFGWYNRNTAFNPFTIEGKKTVAFELFAELGNQAPDNVFVSVGDGCIISGVYKGFEDLLELGLIDKIPTIYAVQSEKSANLADNLATDEFTAKPATTLADSISVDIPRNFFMAKKFLRKYNGKAVKVTDTEILMSSKLLSMNSGLFAEPAGATAYAGMYKTAILGKIRKDTKNVVLLTGSGLKDLNSVQSVIEMPKSISILDELNTDFGIFK